MVDTLKAGLRFERFLFGGVPESADSIYERDGEAHAGYRPSMRSRGVAEVARASGGTVVCLRRYDAILRQTVFDPLPEDSGRGKEPTNKSGE